MNASPAFRPGDAIDGYRVEAQLGSGGFGAVYQVLGREGGQYALKVSHGIASRLTAQQMILHQNEIEALRKVSHPSLVQVFGHGLVDDHQFYVVMELVGGESLGAYLDRRRQLDPLEAVQIARRVADALDHCHQRNLLHRDLKPQNIMIVDPHEPRIKVLDFGLAQLTESLSPIEGESLSGSPHYMAPESFTRGAVDAFHTKSDLYALGVVLFEMLTGTVPFSTTNLGQLIVKKMGSDPTPLQQVLPSVPPGVAALVQSLLARDPARRPGSAATVAARLRELYLEMLHEGGAAPSTFPPPVRSAASGAPGARGAEGASPEEPESWSGHTPDQAPFAGREHELSRLRDHLTAVLAGGTRALSLVGEPGIGKSRLVAELLRQNRVPERAFVASGRCRQLGDLVPYSPLREALVQFAAHLRVLGRRGAEATLDRLAAMDDADTAIFTSLAPEMVDLLPRGHGGAAQNVSAALRLVGAERVGRAIAHLVRALTASRPVVLVIEDLHWADEATLGVIAQLTGSDAAPSTMFVGTNRPGGEPPGANLDLIQLRALDPTESQDLLSLLTGHTGGSPRAPAAPAARSPPRSCTPSRSSRRGTRSRSPGSSATSRPRGSSRGAAAARS